MATSESYYNYIMECLGALEEISSRKMMGEYCIYYRNKLIAEICDNQFLLKPTPSVIKMFPDAERAYPYEGSKTLMVVVEDAEKTELLTKTIIAMYDELPEPKKKK